MSNFNFLVMRKQILNKNFRLNNRSISLLPALLLSYFWQIGLFAQSSIITEIRLEADITKCIGVNGIAQNNGEVLLWDCNKSETFQWIDNLKWIIEGEMEVYPNQKWNFKVERIRSKIDPNYCLYVPSGDLSNGNQIKLYNCSEASREWNYYSEYQEIWIMNNRTKCLDLRDGNTNAGTPIQIWDCGNNNPNQKWIMGNPIELKANSDKCLDLSAGITINGNKVQIWDCNNTNNQMWIYTGYYLRSVVNDKKCLSVNWNNNFTNGSGAMIFDCGANNAAQQWILDYKTGKMKLKDHPTKCLDLSAGNQGNGNKVQIWDCQQGNTNQIWKLD